MKLYRVRRKDNQEFLAQFNYVFLGGSWNKSGSFFKKIDTVRKHIRDLCSTWEWVHGTKYSYIRRIETFKDKYSLYEIVVNDVTINGEYVIDGKDLLK